MFVKKIVASSTQPSTSRRMVFALTAMLTLPLIVACEDNDDPIDNLRDSAEEVREDVEEAANDARRKVEDYQD